jgi:L-fuculose-phosphate aldolase
MWREIAKYGKILVERGLVSGHFGNISTRAGNKILITRTGVKLDELDENSIVEVEIEKPTSYDLIASTETIVHREIYKQTSALAIIHAHSPYAVIESLLLRKKYLDPVDTEGQYFLHRIPIVSGAMGSKELAKNLGLALKEYKGVIVKGHGTFAIGKTLEEAFVFTSMMEHSSMLKYYCDLGKRNKKKK